MSEYGPTRRHAVESIDGVEALINLDPGELFLDLPINTPRYIRVREGNQIQQGDVRTQTSQTMGSLTLSKWRIDTISTDTVTGVDLDTGEAKEWERKWLINQLGTGGLSVELTDFERVNVSEATGLQTTHTAEEQHDHSLHVVVTAYGNNGQKFTQIYSATEPSDWESLTLVKQDNQVQKFNDKLRKEFDAAVAEALEMEKQHHI